MNLNQLNNSCISVNKNYDDFIINESLSSWISDSSLEVQDWYKKQKKVVQFVYSLKGQPKMLQNVATHIHKMNSTKVKEIKIEAKVITDGIDAFISQPNVSSLQRKKLLKKKDVIESNMTYLINQYKTIVNLNGWEKLIKALCFSVVVYQIHAWIFDFTKQLKRFASDIFDLGNMDKLDDMNDYIRFFKSTIVRLSVDAVTGTAGLTILFKLFEKSLSVQKHIFSILHIANVKFSVNVV